MRSIKLVRKKDKYIIQIHADNYYREYVEDSLEVATTRANKIKQLLSIK